jgi:protein-S-isoprenylcysteine O-methyltransferase Ste14
MADLSPRRVSFGARVADLSRRSRDAANAEMLARRRVPLGFIASAAVIWLARPSWRTWSVGLIVACVGEAFRLWAAGHLEKSREVTRSGPYRLTRHPLYVGSSVIALGVVIAANSVLVATIAAIYMCTTIVAAIRTEEAFLRRAFGSTYEEYRVSRAEPMQRKFSWSRAMRNREYRALSGVLIGFALLALRIVLPV